MIWIQKELELPAKKRGFHLVTDEIVQHLPELNQIKIGQCQIFIKHTSASLTINENADPTVRLDFESHFNTYIPENAPYYKHTYEGSDDMPAHLKASVLGHAVQIPISNGVFNLGIWQGVYLGEHRDYAQARTIVITIWGEGYQ